MALPPMPMPGGAPGGMPGAGGPSPMGGAGPATMPTPMHGSQQQGLSSLKVGLEALQKSLPQLPMGSALHQSVLKAVADIGKHLEKEGGAGGDQSGAIQQLMEMARAAKTQPNMAAMMPGGSPAGGPPGAGAPTPPMPPMGA